MASRNYVDCYICEVKIPIWQKYCKDCFEDTNKLLENDWITTKMSKIQMKEKFSRTYFNNNNKQWKTTQDEQKTK